MWVKTKFEGDPIAAVKLVLSSHATGKLVLDFSEGTVRDVEWHEQVQKTTQTKKRLDEEVGSASTVTA